MAVTRPIGIGVIGTGLMGRVQSHALLTLGHVAPGHDIVLAHVCGRDERRLVRFARQYGFRRWSTDWEAIIADPEVDLVANVASNDLHAEVALAALAAGKHIMCEKPLGRNAVESQQMCSAAVASGLLHGCSFNYRFMPAVRLAHEIIESGELGDIVHFRGQYLQDWGWDAPFGWHFERERCGPGAIGDYAHLIDMARYLVGEWSDVTAVALTAPTERPGPDGAMHTVDVEDAYAAVGRLRSGAVVNVEASRLARGHKASQTFEVNGSRGSLQWSLEDLNRLQLFRESDGRLGGFRDISVLAREHPFGELWWPDGHGLGWEHCFVHQWQSFLAAINEPGNRAERHQATFVDGWRADVVAEAIVRSATTGERVTIQSSHYGAVQQGGHEAQPRS
jgi:predicted dehydrogenase